MASYTKVTHVIFDMDGLLLDTERFYTDVQTAILRRYGKKFTWALKVFVDDTGLAGQLTPEEFVTEREAALDEMFPSSQLMPGAERLLRHLHRHGIPFALATSSHRRHFDLKTTQHRPLFELFDHRITGDEVVSGKPAPEIFLKAARRFSPPAPPGGCLVFEDAVTGVAAGKAAGMCVVMVPDPNLDRTATAAADEVIQSLEAFQPEKWGLPPFDSAAVRER